MNTEAIRKFNADLMERSIANDRKTFAEDVAYMTQLAGGIMHSTSEGLIRLDDLTSLAQRVSALLVLGSKIQASTEMHKVLAVDLTEKG